MSGKDIKNVIDLLIHSEEKLNNTFTQLNNAKVQIIRPFTQDGELKEKVIWLDRLNHELSKDEVSAPGDDDILKMRILK